MSFQAAFFFVNTEVLVEKKCTVDFVNSYITSERGMWNCDHCIYVFFWGGVQRERKQALFFFPWMARMF